MKLTNPFTGEELDRPSTSSNDLKQSFNFQKENQKAWGDLPLEQRLSIIEKFSDELQKREEKLAKILTKE